MAEIDHISFSSKKEEEMLYLELSQNKKRELRVFFCKEIFGGKREAGGAWILPLIQ